MAAAQKPAPIVAELGRPETREETAARKAETSRKHRANQTMLNLVVALIASLAIVLFLVVVVVRPEPAGVAEVDYLTVAEQAQVDADEPLIAPTLPPGWYANDARFENVAEVPSWYIGLITPKTQFVALVQGIGANPTWQASVLDGATQTGTTTIDGVEWSVFDNRDSDDPGNFAYSLAATFGESTVLLHGTADDVAFETLASAVAAEVTP